MSIGLPIGETTQEFFIAPLTAKTHVARLFRKLEVIIRAVLVAKAKDLNLGGVCPATSKI